MQIEQIGSTPKQDALKDWNFFQLSWGQFHVKLTLYLLFYTASKVICHNFDSCLSERIHRKRWHWEEFERKSMRGGSYNRRRCFKKKNTDTDIKTRAQINTHSHTCAHTQVYLESTVAEHSYDTEKYHGGQYSSGYDNSSSCHPTSSPSNSATAQPVWHH